MNESDPLAMPWSELQIAVMHRLHDWSLSNAAVERGLAGWMGLPASDAGALGHVVWAAENNAPLSPAGLADRIGLTSGATTLLVDRLASRGHVVRSRESTDRRRVTLRPTAETRDRVRAFLVTAGSEVAATLSSTSASDLRVIAAFLGRLDEANRFAVERMRADD